MAHTALEESESVHTRHKSWKGPVDPASYEDHGKHVGDISLHHVCQHAGICVKTVRMNQNANKLPESWTLNFIVSSAG